ncbi:MAG: helicase-related protein, partial [Candidatus Sumerlaeota bacterium]
EQAGIILPHDRIGAFAKKEKPEILIVDEVHRLLHDPKAIMSLVALSRNAHAVLLLTATPVADDWQNLLTLHRLIDPDRFASMDSPEQFRALQEKQPAIEQILRAIRASEPDPNEVAKLYAASGIKDKEIESHLKEAHHDVRGRHELHRIATLLVDRYYPGARLLRYQRKFLAQDNALPLRIYGTLEYKPDSEELAIFALVESWLSIVRDQKLSRDPDAQNVATTLIQAAHSSHLALADWLLARTKKLPARDGVTADPTRLNRQSMADLPMLDGEKKLLAEIDTAIQKWQRATRAVDAQGRALAKSPRYLAFLNFLKETLEEDPDAHLLVFTSFEANVHPLWLLLRKALTDMAEVYEMSGLQTRVEREKNAFEFQEFPSGSVLISDELGGEGRNFQFASHVIHFDLPIAPWTVEQRIGRCDRVGRDQEDDVDSQVLLAKGQLDEAFFEFQAEALGVFNDSIAPVEGELERIMEGAIATCIDEGAGAVIDLIDDVKQHIESARERSNEELLLRGAVGVEEAKRVAEDLKDDKELVNLRKAVIDYAKLFDSMVDEQDGGRVAVTVGEYHSLHGMPGIAQEMIGYFDRRSAIRHERLNFFSPGHPFVRSMALMAMTESPDRAAIIARKGIEEPAALFTYRISLSPEFIAKARDLPLNLRAPLLSKSSHLFASKMLRVAITLKGEVIPRIKENELYYETLRADDLPIESAAKITAAIPDDWETLCLDLAAQAEEQAREVNDAQVADIIESFEDIVCEAMTRVHPAHSLAETEVASLMELVRDLSVDLDSAVLFLPK